MFKNMKLGTKIGAGFAIVLILTAVIGYVGFGGLSDVEEIVDKADDANRLIKLAKDCRQQEKNFIMRDDKKYQTQNGETVVMIYKQIDETKAKFVDQADRDLIEQVRADIQSYKGAFDAWTADRDKQKIEENNMVESARLL